MHLGSLRISSSRLLGVAVLLVVVVAGGLAAGLATRDASSAPAQTTLQACVNRYTGAVRMLWPGTSGVCSSGEYMIEWNSQGIQGEQGPPGPQGPQGEQGPPGPPGDTSGLVPRAAMTVGCVDGDNVLSGGYEFIIDTDGFSPPHVVINRPHNLTQTQEGWIVQVFHDETRLITDVFAVCASAADATNTYQVNQRYDVAGQGGGEGEGGGGGDDGR